MQPGFVKSGKEKGSGDLRWGRSFVVTALMVGIILLVSIGVMHSINSMERRGAFERLYTETGTIARHIENSIATDREQLELLAGVLAQYSDLRDPKLWKLLSSYDSIGMMSRVDVLLPSNYLLTQDGRAVDVRSRLDFETLAQAGAQVSGRMTDLLDEDSYVIHHYVPVQREGRTVAMLIGVVAVSKLPESVGLMPYGGRGDLYVLDAVTGDFLMDTWHPGRMGNLWDLGKRKMAPGYDSSKLTEGVVEGKRGHVIFVSKTIGEYLYFYFEPMEVNAWRIAVSVPESVVFGSASIIEQRLNLFLGFEFVCFAVYLVWMGRMVRKVTNYKQRRLDEIQHLNQIEQLLFNAHHDLPKVCTALKQLSTLFRAERAALWVEGHAGQRLRFAFEEGKEVTGSLTPGRQSLFDYLQEWFAQDHPVFSLYGREAIERAFPAGLQPSVRSLLAVPVKDLGSG